MSRTATITFVALAFLLPGVQGHSGGPETDGNTADSVHDILVRVRLVNGGEEAAIVTPYGPLPRQVGSEVSVSNEETVSVVGHDVTILARAPGHWSARVDLTELSAQNEVEMNLLPREQDGTEWSIHVQGIHGEPLPGTEVRALWDDEEHLLFQKGITGDDGRVKFEMPGPGTARIWVVNDFYQPSEITSEVSDADEISLNLTPRPGILVIPGRVTLDGEPAGGIPVYLQNAASSRGRVLYLAHAVSMDDGSFHIATAPGNVSLLAIGPSADRSIVAHARDNAEPIHISLDPEPNEARLTVRVTGPNGLALPSAEVQVLSLNHPTIGYAGSTKNDGTYGMILPEGRVMVYARCPDCESPLLERTIFVEARPPTSTIDLALDRDDGRSRLIRGSVTDADGSSLPGAPVALIDMRQAAVLQTVLTGDDGTYEMLAPTREGLFLAADGAPHGPSKKPLDPFILRNGFQTQVRAIPATSVDEQMHFELDRANDSYLLEVQLGTSGSSNATLIWHPWETAAVLDQLILPMRHGIQSADIARFERAFRDEPLLRGDVLDLRLENVHVKVGSNAVSFATTGLDLKSGDEGMTLLLEGNIVTDPWDDGAHLFTVVPPLVEWTMVVTPPHGRSLVQPEGVGMNEDAALVFHSGATLAPKEIILPLTLERSSGPDGNRGSAVGFGLAALTAIAVAVRFVARRNP